ncbi:LacI family transcriptional regulator [Actinotalea sp. M2MS4P-6]|uniref:LacI family DNA-binding transcriptional regulator n=1 Tax=Actinotalea sp. M2MS4P-6 TaxID=2983762 RepID=UPI0021E43BA1|nr:LacI family DNA-binding transcriptional regulator [Actinotalea sp. M2MS4P-6]MCV2394220.1 LacI family transcriptional regulator [Actinotalea sp. M2MS4P-6]
MAVTAKDVARAAGVSAATVSYVINDHPGQKITDATRKRVLEAAEQLGYQPSEAARALRRGTSQTVLLLIPDVTIGEVMAELIDTLTDVLDAAGLSAATRRAAAGTLRQTWAGLRPAAVVVVGPLGPSGRQELRDAGVPVVDVLGPASGDDGQEIPQQHLGRMQVEHLTSRGHTAIGYAAPEDPRFALFLDGRLAGVRGACRERGMPEPVVVPVRLDVASAEEAVARWLYAGVTAIAAYNDEAAFAVLAGMHRLGMSAPDDLAVIGLDDIALAALASPPLTTIDQRVDLLAEHLAALVLHRAHGAPQPPAFDWDVATLVVREST